MSEPGARLDLSSDVRPADAGRDAGGRPFLGVHFQCCSVYGRVYRDASGDAYRGHCPRCLGAIEVGIGPGGSSSRFFSAS